ncbi:MAG: AbrB/MazE/SpoVT family DNA-binding domain-containing protein [Planctomycetia bacterium]|nr:AbrB/MazE/SpoVT family DNA-binding domain-containing protein [Planctomycetia bacterium]
MKMTKNLMKVGNSFCLIVPKSILRLLDIDEDTLLRITTDGKNIAIRPIRKKGKKERK